MAHAFAIPPTSASQSSETQSTSTTTTTSTTTVKKTTKPIAVEDDDIEDGLEDSSEDELDEEDEENNTRQKKKKTKKTSRKNKDKINSPRKTKKTIIEDEDDEEEVEEEVEGKELEEEKTNENTTNENETNESDKMIESTPNSETSTKMDIVGTTNDTTSINYFPTSVPSLRFDSINDENLLEVIRLIPQNPPPESIKLSSSKKLTKEVRNELAVIAVKRAFSECPSLSVLVDSLLKNQNSLHDLHKLCTLTPGIIIIIIT